MCLVKSKQSAKQVGKISDETRKFLQNRMTEEIRCQEQMRSFPFFWGKFGPAKSMSEEWKGRMNTAYSFSGFPIS